ncbi:hypothetical protein DRO66_02575 [Candidatus Bathyarchaeota archaeon]|nr:MAG: hypothetical protein DRO66_02575 [Candidatus Bathyarchaeota archaeon]
MLTEVVLRCQCGNSLVVDISDVDSEEEFTEILHGFLKADWGYCGEIQEAHCPDCAEAGADNLEDIT